MALTNKLLIAHIYRSRALLSAAHLSTFAWCRFDSRPRLLTVKVMGYSLLLRMYGVRLRFIVNSGMCT